MELHQAQTRIKLLEENKAEQDNEVPSCYVAFALHNILFELLEISSAHYLLLTIFDILKINQYKAYISEVMLHAEAQSSQYQQKVLD